MQREQLVLMRQYAFEEQWLTKFACKSKNTKGREKTEKPCLFRTDFQRDRDRILYSKAFLRLKNKTQVFFLPQSDHYRTRLTHTLLVAQVAKTITKTLFLNEDLAEAIALGHDLGHTPFGHTGERILNKLLQYHGGFKHNEQSLRIVDLLEQDGQGLNLTYEVRDGIIEHKKTGTPKTLEGQAVSLADRIAYLTHDIEDAIRAGILKPKDLPSSTSKYLGKTTSERVNNAILSIYEESIYKPYVRLRKQEEEALHELREFMFQKVYLIPEIRKEESKIEKMLSMLFTYFCENAHEMPPLYKKIAEKEKIERAVCDYIASMTDKYVVDIFQKIYVPKYWTIEEK